jgi:hypothetical protein
MPTFLPLKKMTFTIYLAFALMSLLSAVAALSIGAYYWRSLHIGLRVLVVLLLAGVAIDGYGLCLVYFHLVGDRIWLSVNHLLQFALVIFALLQLGKDILLTRLYWLLNFLLFGYCLAWFAVLLFAPEWFKTPYVTPITYLLLLFAVTETALQYQHTSSLSSSIPDRYVFFGFILYAFGTILLHVVKQFIPPDSPSLVYISHGIFAAIKNYCLIRAFLFDAWNPRQ